MTNLDMLINFVPDEECRIALVENGRLEELYVERTSAALHVNNIYRGRVTNVEPSIQAAFIDFGLDRAGFLHVSDLHPRYFRGADTSTTERVGQKTPRRDRPPIQQCLKRGQQVLVQVLKEGIGTKGPTLTSYLSIPGRFLVMMPNMERHGVSRKIEDQEKRRQMRRILDELDPPDDLGFIVRTAGFDRTKSELKRDLNYLLRLWKDIKQKMKTGSGPAELYTESDLVIRTIRDVLTSDVQRIIVDDRVAALRARQFLRIAMPRTSTKVYHHSGPMPLFDAYDIERQVLSINDRIVPLPSGGSLVFDSTEAMVAIDVNSGKFRDNKDPAETAYRTNLEAVEEISRQLRLRDLGGLIVLDLIDMYVSRHRREVERQFRSFLKKDRARTKDLRISELGLLEMTRQRMRPSLKKAVFDECTTCGGSGHVLSPESVSLDLMRKLTILLHSDAVARVEVSAHPSVVAMLFNRKRKAVSELEAASGKSVAVTINPAIGADQATVICYDAKGGIFDPQKLPKHTPPKLTEADEVTVSDMEELDEMLFEDESEDSQDPQAEAADDGQPTDSAREGGGRKRRRRRRRRSRRADSPTSDSPESQPENTEEAKAPQPAEPAADAADAESAPPSDAPAKKRRRRRGGRRRRRRSGAAAGGSAETSAETAGSGS